jgi:hypothetical protein
MVDGIPGIIAVAMFDQEISDPISLIASYKQRSMGICAKHSEQDIPHPWIRQFNVMISEEDRTAPRARQTAPEGSEERRLPFCNGY